MTFLEPKNLKFGKDIRKIKFKKDKVIKYFKTKKGYDRTLNFIKLMNQPDFLPKIYKKDPKNFIIEMENCGNLLSLSTLPCNWEDQFNLIKNQFIKKNLFILDIRFMPFTPMVLNNLCVKNNKIYLIDLVMYRKRDQKFIDIKFKILINQIKFFLFLIKIPLIGKILAYIIHYILEVLRMVADLYEIIVYKDIYKF